jgi:hypothetical protein
MVLQLNSHRLWHCVAMRVLTGRGLRSHIITPDPDVLEGKVHFVN